MVVEVAIGKRAPVFWRERSEGGVGLERLRLALGGEFIYCGSESGAAIIDVAIVDDDELRSRGSAFGPRKNVDDELLQRPEPEGRVFGLYREFTHGGEDGKRAVPEHLSDRHFAPDGALIGLNRVEAGE